MTPWKVCVLVFIVNGDMYGTNINDSLTITRAQLLIARTVMSFHYYSCRYLPPLPSTHVCSDANNEGEIKISQTISELLQYKWFPSVAKLKGIKSSVSAEVFDFELPLVLGDRFWWFIQTLNNAKKPFSSIFNSKTKSNYSFKEFIHSKIKLN